MVEKKQRYVTTDYVLSELITGLFRTLDFEKSRTFVQNLLESIHDGRHQLVFVSPDQFQRDWQLRQLYHDKPNISFVDLTSIVVMQDLQIVEIFTGDAHFRHVGLGFRMLP